MKQFFLTIKEILEVVAIALVTVFIIRHFLIQPFLVSGASMEPNFSDGNYLLIDEITYRFREPIRGEVVVFRYPRNPSTFFIKRIIGVPGDEIAMKRGAVYVNNVRLDEEYVPKVFQTQDSLSVKLGKDEYFVLGDNRSHSFDSRNWGTLRRDKIIGLARFRLFPLNEIGYFSYQQ